MEQKVSLHHMDSLRISLSARLLGTLRVPATEDNFTFVVDGRCYCFPSTAAEFLSPWVRDLHALDATINELSLVINNDSDIFEKLIAFSQGEAVELLPVCSALRNWELAGSIDRLLNPSQTADAAIGRLLLYSQTPSDIDFLASRFCDVAGFGISMLSDIISHPALQIESEDWLFDYIAHKMELDTAFINLFEFVEFRYISASKMSDFINMVSGSAAALNISILRKLLDRLAGELVAPRES
jgi:hypothetical protein